MERPKTGEFHWKKSSYSGGSGTECVEAAVHSAGVAVRDSKAAQSPVLLFTDAAWTSFTQEIHSGRLS